MSSDLAWASSLLVQGLQLDLKIDGQTDTYDGSDIPPPLNTYSMSLKRYQCSLLLHLLNTVKACITLYWKQTNASSIW